jgi:hypothetical protein
MRLRGVDAFDIEVRIGFSAAEALRTQPFAS